MRLHNISKLRNLQALSCVLVIVAALRAQQVSPLPVSVPYAGATISDFKGKIELNAHTQDSLAATRGLSLAAGTEVNTGNGKLLLHLTDGSEVLLGPHTRLILTQPSASDWKYLQLIIGKIRVEVEKRLGGTPSFQIGTPSAVISVRGTRFLVEVNRRGVTEVDVEQGLVELTSVNDLGRPVLLGAGLSSRVGEELGPEAARPTRELRPELERPEHKNSADRKLELDDIASRSDGHGEHSELGAFDEREENRPGSSSTTEPSRTEPGEAASPELNL